MDLTRAMLNHSLEIDGFRASNLAAACDVKVCSWKFMLLASKSLEKAQEESCDGQ